jgi:hypothetical protein
MDFCLVFLTIIESETLKGWDLQNRKRKGEAE